MAEKKCPVCQTPIENGVITCPSCHFKLSGATQRFKPVFDLQEAADEPKQTVACLLMVRGPQIGTVFNLDRDYITIGRNPKCDIFLDDMTVSRDHADISRHGDAFIIKDLQSFNGIWINNRTINEHALRPDDYVQIGKYDFIYSENELNDTEVDV